jgi:hypothetical protein
MISLVGLSKPSLPNWMNDELLLKEYYSMLITFYFIFIKAKVLAIN